MPTFLILKLRGPMQAWGTHTFEDFRPSNLFPTRSGLLGLLGACLGLDRKDDEMQAQLAQSVEFAVRVDEGGVKLPDFHTVLAARKVDGKPNPNPVMSRREYLYGAAFTVVVGGTANAAISLDAIGKAVQCPLYTPVLGRRSCALADPLFTGWREAADLKAALDQDGGTGAIYVEGDACGDERPIELRDVPMRGSHRRFGKRRVYLLGNGGA